MSFLGDFLKLLRFGREERRAEHDDQRASNADHRADRRELLELLDHQIDNAERAVELATNDSERDRLIETIRKYRAIKDAAINEQIKEHESLLSIELFATEAYQGALEKADNAGETKEPSEASTVGIESATVGPKGTIGVSIFAEVPRPGIAAFEIDILYDRSLIRAYGCDPSDEPISVCNHAFGPNMVRLVGASATGHVGKVRLGTIMFSADAREGVATLRLNVSTLIDPYFKSLIPELVIKDGTIRVGD